MELLPWIIFIFVTAERFYIRFDDRWSELWRCYSDKLVSWEKIIFVIDSV